MGLGERVAVSWRGGAASPWATVVLVACALGLLHYWVTWFRAARTLPCVHHPLALMYLAARRLWRNRTLVGVLLGLLLVGTVTSYFWLSPVQSEKAALSFGRPYPGPPALFASHPEMLTTAWQRFLSAQIVVDVGQRLPRPQGLEVVGLRPAANCLALLALSAGLIALWVRRPGWLAPELRKRLPWPALLTAGAAAVWGSAVYVSSYGLEAFMQQRWVAEAQFAAQNLGGALCTAPALALAWSLTWQVARGRRWNLHQAVRDMLRCWPTVLVILLALGLGFEILMFPLSFLRSIPPLLVMTVQGLNVLGQLIVAFFFCLPWVIVGDKLGLREALAEVVDIWRKHWRDLAYFIPRYTAIMLLAGIPFRVLGEMTQGGLVTGFLSEGLRLLYRLVGALAVVIWYVEVRKLRRGEGASAEAAVNPAPAQESAL